MYKRPTDLTLYALARSLARVAHFGQTRRGNGEPYFEHVHRVALAIEQGHGTERAAIIALLHDTIEDTSVTAEALEAVGFPYDIVVDVGMLTRSPDQEYLHYIGRLVEFGSVDALHVKLADLRDNLRDIDELPLPDYKVDELNERYTKALTWVKDALIRRSASSEYGTPIAA